MRRVVITGIGALSCIGNTQEAIVDSLKAGRSGITFNEKYKEMGLKSNVAGSVDIDIRAGSGQIGGLRIGNPEGYAADDAFDMSRLRLDIDLRSLGRQGNPLRRQDFHGGGGNPGGIR